MRTTGYWPRGAVIELDPCLKKARFISRINRFAALVVCDGREIVAHVPNSGRLRELLHPGNPMLLAPAPADTRRRTAYDLALVEVDGVLVSVDARLPNALLQEAIEAGRLASFVGYERLAREIVFGDSRLDIMLSGEPGRCYLEAKSVTLVRDGVAIFPDAPTRRGRKHLKSLISASKLGHRAAVAFVIQRRDAHAFSTNEDADPQFCQTLREAVRSGVEVYAYRCSVSSREIEVAAPVPVRLG